MGWGLRKDGMCPEGDAEEAGGPARTTRGAVRVLGPRSDPRGHSFPNSTGSGVQRGTLKKGFFLGGAGEAAERWERSPG